MAELKNLVVGGLATFRLALLVVEEDGPFEVFGRARHKIGQWTLKDEKRNWVWEGIHCIWCVSFWVGLFLALARRKGLSEGLAYSAIAIILNTLLEESVE